MFSAVRDVQGQPLPAVDQLSLFLAAFKKIIQTA